MYFLASHPGCSGTTFPVPPLKGLTTGSLRLRNSHSALVLTNVVIKTAHHTSPSDFGPPKNFWLESERSSDSEVKICGGHVKFLTPKLAPPLGG